MTRRNLTKYYYLSDEKLEPARLPQGVSWYAAMTDPIVGSIVGLAKTELETRMADYDSRLRIVSPEEVSRYSFDEVSAWVRRCWLGGPLEIGVTGDIDIRSALIAAAASLGTLPTRNDAPILKSERLQLPAKPYRNIVTYQGSPEKAESLYFAWPAGDITDFRVYCALQLATDALVERLRVKLREELGATYSPSGNAERSSFQRDFGYAWVNLTFAPNEVSPMVDRVIKLADDFARHGLTKEEFTRLGEPRRTAIRQNLLSNEWWLSEVLVAAQSQPAVLGDARSLLQTFTELTRDEVNRAAASHFRAENFDLIGVSP